MLAILAHLSQYHGTQDKTKDNVVIYNSMCSKLYPVKQSTLKKKIARIGQQYNTPSQENFQNTVFMINSS